MLSIGKQNELFVNYYIESNISDECIPKKFRKIVKKKRKQKLEKYI